MYKSRAGFILMPVVFLLLILAGLTHGMLCLILEETWYQQEFLRYRQVLRLGTDLLEAVEKQPRLPQAGTYQLPEIEFYPGKETIRPQVTLDYRPRQQVQSITVHFAYGDEETWKLRKLYLEPPGGCQHPLYKQAALSGQSVGGADFPLLEEPLYKRYNERPLPKAVDSLETGLKGYLYVGDKQTYYLPVAPKAAGAGVFYNPANIHIGAGTTFTDRIWFLSTGTIYVGDNVRLPNAFLFAQGSIILGRNVEVCGIIIARNKIVMDANSIVRGNEQVVQTFITPSYIP